MNLDKLKPHPYRRLWLMLLTGLALAGFLWFGPPRLSLEQILIILALFAAWIFLGIPTCCGFDNK